MKIDITELEKELAELDIQHKTIPDKLYWWYMQPLENDLSDNVLLEVADIVRKRRQIKHAIKVANEQQSKS